MSNVNTMIWRRDDGTGERHTHQMPSLFFGNLFREDLKRYAAKVFAANPDVTSVEVYAGRGRAGWDNFLTLESRGDAA